MVSASAAASNSVDSGKDSVLNSFRGIAIIGVIWHHSTAGLASLNLETTQHFSFSFILNTVVLCGYKGVDLFFILSGYVLTESYQRIESKGKVAWIGYYRRRAKRLLPLYWLAVIILTSFNVGGNNASNYLAHLAYYLTFGYLVSDFSQYKSIGIPGISLGIEVLFSIFVPLVWAARKKMGSPLLLLAYVAPTFLVSEAAIVNRLIHPNLFIIWYSLYSSIPFFCGVLLYDTHLFIKRNFDTIPNGAALLALLIGFLLSVCVAERPPEPLDRIIYDFFNARELIFLLSLSLMILSLQLSTGVVRKIATNWPLQLIGMMCYSLFIWHSTFIGVFNLKVDSSTTGALNLVVGYSMMILFSFLSYRYIEFPSRPLRNLFPERNLPIKPTATCPGGAATETA